MFNSNDNMTFVFSNLPKNLSELQAMPESALSTPYQTAALTVAALCRYGESVDDCIEMLDFLKGPAPMSPYEKQFLRDRLSGKTYKPFSFFNGATPANGYTPSMPYTITISSGPYSFTDQNYAKLNLKSGGADSLRQITLRLKPSTGQWFLVEQFLLSDIRIPVSEDPWA